MYLTKWDESVHNTPDQKKRLESAKTQNMQLLSLDVKTKSGTVKSPSGSSVYQVTTESCDCKDFKVRKLPCKHMYFLDLALEKETQKAPAPIQTAPTPTQTVVAKPNEKNKTVEFILALLFGWMGAHKFYKGKFVAGVVWLLTFGLFGFGWGLDVLILLIALLTQKPAKKTNNTPVPIAAEVKPKIVQPLPQSTAKKPEPVQIQKTNPLADKLSYDYVLWRYLTTDHSTVEPTYTKREYHCAAFDILLKNILNVNVILHDRTVARKIGVPSPFARSSSISTKTNTKNISSFVAIDVETTGLNADKDNIIEIGAVKFNGFKPVAAFSTLLKPSVPISADATAVNNITNAMVANSPTFSQIKGSLEAFIGDLPIVAHNAEFDVGFLHTSGLDFSSKVKFFDTLTLSRKHIRDQEGNKLGSYKLIDVCADCNIYFDGAHRSTTDALATGLLFIEIIKRVFETNSVLDIQQK